MPHTFDDHGTADAPAPDVPGPTPERRTHTVGDTRRDQLPGIGEPGYVRLVDAPSDRVRRPQDLVAITLCLLGIGVILLLTVFAHATTVGVQQDVQGFSRLLGRILLFPVAILESLVTLLVPVAVVIDLSVRRLGRQLVEALTAAGASLVLALLAYVLVDALASEDLRSGLSILQGGVATLSLPAFVAAISGLLTGSGPRTRRRTVGWSWNLLWVTIIVFLITAQVSLPGVAVMLLVGRIGGLAVRYVSGVRSERAHGADLVDGVRRAGFEPLSLVRVRDLTDAPDDVERSVSPQGTVSDPQPIPRSGPWWSGSAVETVVGTPDASSFDPSALALLRSADHRVYALTTAERDRLDVVVLDGERQVLGFLTRAWRSLRMRGLEGRSAISLRSVAERAALLMHAARSAGVRTPELLGVAEAADSMLLIQEHAAGTVSLRDLDADALTDEVLRECWRQLRRAHSVGLAHRSLTADVVLVAQTHAEPQVWLTGWENGDIASSTLARRMDLTQMLTLLALRVGPQRALASAGELIDDAVVESLGPLLQTVALPRSTREEIRSEKSPVLGELRAEIAQRLPEANLEPERLVRFGARTIITVTLTLVAVVVVVTKLNFQQITAAVATANPWWALVCFAAGTITWLGAALGFLAFSPVRIGVWRATLTQAASSYVALAAPAGIGSAALNLRLLTRRGVSGALAGATVALVQVSQVVVTVALLAVLTVVSGDGGLLRALPSVPVLVAVGILGLLITAVMLVPRLRRWIVARVEPLWAQTWPRLSSVFSDPKRLLVALLGNSVLTLGLVFAFDAALRAFGQSVSLIDVAVIYLIGNTVGAAAPTPGGVGAIELVLAGSLTATAGVPAGIAATVVMLFRVMTYWVRIPIGWVAMHHLQRKGDL